MWAYVHCMLHTHTPKNIFSACPQAFRMPMIVNWIHFDWNVSTLCIRKKVQWLDHADSWLTWAWTHCGIWSTLAQTHISSFEFMSTWLERQLVQVLYFWSRYTVNHRNVFIGFKILCNDYYTVFSALLSIALPLFLSLERMGNKAQKSECSTSSYCLSCLFITCSLCVLL